MAPKVESFILDQEDLDNPIMKTASELLLSSATDGVDLRTVDPETQARLEALLEAAGMRECLRMLQAQDTFPLPKLACWCESYMLQSFRVRFDHKNYPMHFLVIL